MLVPNIMKNLVLVGQTLEYGMQVCFDSNISYTEDLKNRTGQHGLQIRLKKQQDQKINIREIKWPDESSSSWSPRNNHELNCGCLIH